MAHRRKPLAVAVAANTAVLVVEVVGGLRASGHRPGPASLKITA